MPPLRPKPLRECGYSACHHPRWRVDPVPDRYPLRQFVTCVLCGAYYSEVTREWAGGSLDWIPDPLLVPPCWPLTPATDPEP